MKKKCKIISRQACKGCILDNKIPILIPYKKDIPDHLKLKKKLLIISIY